MPCPYFFPVEPLKDTGWAIPPRAPLGGLCSGQCHAGAEPAPADHERCNFGYARGLCPRFPAAAAVDAIRFARRGREIIYILEREGSPVEHGLLPPTPDPVLAAQAAFFTRLG